ncbi:LysR family transcriptional regulator [Yangia mangrovi]|uniref:LysR family transcriptional regulator n=2 Tax=Roseobacteraceae TaxID=2854170 RepID=A0A2A3K0P3_9RHOB|nr:MULTISPECIES: LysR family transcriptional regulator [Roseobacteraceae]MBE9639804.1 LysR family transcriptional regulator [Salipiger mangrovisoli]MCT4370776.1 LysR family transcriptional regulator [Alloyangia mangrovi]
MSDIPELETFVCVAHAGSFAAAARRLGLSPAMVGRRVQSLEDRYGVRLVERTTRSLRLTDQGQEFLAQTKRILDGVEALADIGQTKAALKGRVRISAPTTLGTKKLATIVAGLIETAPMLTVELSLNDRKVDLISEGYDCAIRVGNLQPSGLVARRIGTYRFVCCASPDFLSRNTAPTTPADLSGLPCILNLNLQPRDQWRFLDSSGQPVIAEVKGAIELDYDEAQRMAALAGAGIVQVPLHLVEEDISRGALIEVLASWGQPQLPIHAVYPSRRYVPQRVAALVDAIKEGLREAVQAG